MKNKQNHTTNEELLLEVELLKRQLEEAHDVIEAIRTGQVDAIVVEGSAGHELYTLKTADHTYRMFIENMPEGALTLNQSGDIVYSNSQFATIIGLEISEVIGASFKNFIEAKCRKRFEYIFSQAWTKDTKEELTLHWQGQTIPVQLSLSRLQMEEEFSLSIIVTDLTVQKEHQEQLKRSNEQLEVINEALERSNHDLQQFASVASHDLQEPLRKIQLFADILMERYAGELSDNARLSLQKIMDSSTRMKVLVQDILNYSKLSANNNMDEVVDLNNLVNAILEDYELVIEEKKATVNVGPLYTVRGNRGQIRQVFQNLISNSLKFSSPERLPVIDISGKFTEELKVSSKVVKKGNYYEIRFRDNGIGFEDKYQVNIFSLFMRLHPKDKFEGSGIGLAIAKKIIEKHNGTIAVSAEQGKGANFTVVLPLVQTDN